MMAGIQVSENFQESEEIYYHTSSKTIGQRALEMDREEGERATGDAVGDTVASESKNGVKTRFKPRNLRGDGRRRGVVDCHQKPRRGRPILGFQP